MQLNTLTSRTPRNNSKRVGRGNASGKGKTSGRGTKGQKARAGHKIWPNVREQIKKLPKLRGYRMPSIQAKPLVVNIAMLEKSFNSGDTVNATTLKEHNLIHVRRGKSAPVKILADGEITKKLTIVGCAVSGAAKEKIEKAGGTVTVKVEA